MLTLALYFLLALVLLSGVFALLVVLSAARIRRIKAQAMVARREGNWAKYRELMDQCSCTPVKRQKPAIPVEW